MDGSTVTFGPDGWNVRQRPGANMSAFEQPTRYRDTPGASDPYVSPDATTPRAILVTAPTHSRAAQGIDCAGERAGARRLQSTWIR